MSLVNSLRRRICKKKQYCNENKCHLSHYCKLISINGQIFKKYITKLSGGSQFKGKEIIER